MDGQRQGIGRRLARWLSGSRLGGNRLSPVPFLTAAAQTRLSWASVVQSFADLPEPFRAAFARVDPGSVDPFPYAVLTPAREGFLRRTTPKLIWGLGDMLYILEQARGQALATCYAYADISYVEVGKVLLKAWLTIQGCDGDGRWTAARLDFNTVNDALFDPFIERMRRPADQGSPAACEQERRKFDYLEGPNYKFMNYARRSIRPGDTVSGCLLQPEMRAPVFGLLGRSLTRSVAPAHLLILTGRELIVLEDPGGGHISGGQAIRYGAVWSYIPLDCVTTAALSPRGELLVLLLALRGGGRAAWPFALDHRPELEALLQDRVPLSRSTTSVFDVQL